VSFEEITPQTTAKALAVLTGVQTYNLRPGPAKHRHKPGVCTGSEFPPIPSSGLVTSVTTTNRDPVSQADGDVSYLAVYKSMARREALHGSEVTRTKQELTKRRWPCKQYLLSFRLRSLKERIDRRRTGIDRGADLRATCMPSTFVHLRA